MSMSTVKVKTPKTADSTNLYELNANTFQLPKGIIPLDVLHRVNHKVPQYLSIPILNAKNVPCSISKNMLITSMHYVEKCDEVQEISCSRLWCDTSKLLPKISLNTSLQLEPDTKSSVSSIPDVEISGGQDDSPGIAEQKYPQIITQKHNRYWQDQPNWVGHSDGRPTYCIKTIHRTAEIPQVHRSQDQATGGSGHHFAKYEQLGHPILIVPKKQDHVDTDNPQGSNNGKFNLQPCINYRKLNSHTQTACQIKADDSLGKVISNYPLLTIDTILVCFNSYKYFSNINLNSGYYHIKQQRSSREDSIHNQ